MARALRPGTLGPTGTPTGTWQRGPGGLAPDDDGGGGLGPPVVAEVVLEVLLDEASLLVAHLGVGVLGGGEGEAAAREVEVDGRLSRPRLPHARPQRQLHAHVEYMPTWFGPWSSSSMRALLASTRTSRHVAVARVPSRPSYMCRPLVASLRCEEKNELAWVKNHNLSLQEHRPWGARLTADFFPLFFGDGACTGTPFSIDHPPFLPRFHLFLTRDAAPRPCHRGDVPDALAG